MDDLAGKRVTVMGLGRFGGGVGVTRWLADQGAHVLVTDLAPEDSLAGPLEQIRDLTTSGAVRLRLGRHDEDDFRTPDLVVANPAVPLPWENAYLNAARRAGVPITTEMELLVHRLPNRLRTIGVTGSAGKSTTAAMIHHVLAQCAGAGMGGAGGAHLGGNLGGSLLGVLDQISPDDWIVLELSSAMLHWIDAWSPHVAVITNLRANHIDWHGSFEHYKRSKQNILNWQQAGDIAVFTESPADLDAAPGVREVVVTAEPAGAARPLRVLGAHNRINASTAAAACAALNLPALTTDRCWQALATFPGLPHRLQFTCEADGIRYYNDSKSTTPEATVMALGAFDDPRRIHLIAGGHDKGLDLAPLSRAARACAGLYTIGATGPNLTGPERTIHCDTLDRAVEAARAAARPGDVILLSPGCASWGQFTNYEDRGDRFTTLARTTPAQAGGSA